MKVLHNLNINLWNSMNSFQKLSLFLFFLKFQEEELVSYEKIWYFSRSCLISSIAKEMASLTVLSRG